MGGGVVRTGVGGTVGVRMFDGVSPAAVCRHCKTRVATRESGRCGPCHAGLAGRDAERARRPKPAVCLNCQNPARSVNRPRGLCWGCYYTPGVKELYPPASPYARRGIGNVNRTSRLPAAATDAEPGTAEKVAVMCERAARGESLFHPGDPKVLARAGGYPGLFVLTRSAAVWRRTGGKRHVAKRIA